MVSSNPELTTKMIAYKKIMMDEVEGKASRLEKEGFAEYLKQL